MKTCEKGVAEKNIVRNENATKMKKKKTLLNKPGGWHSPHLDLSYSHLSLIIFNINYYLLFYNMLELLSTL